MPRRFIATRDAQVEESPWGPHEWISRPGLTEALGLLMVRVTMPPGKAHRFHKHPELEEIIYVVGGSAEQWVDRDMRILAPGDSAHIPANTVHATHNAGSDPLVFLAILSPATCAGPLLVEMHDVEPWASLRPSPVKTVLLIGTLDTKGEEYRFVRELIRLRGHRALLMDIGVLGDAPYVPDFSAAEVARAGGQSLQELRSRADRGTAVSVMQRGAMVLTRTLYAEGKVDAVLGLGGGGGTAMITAAMRELPVGVPKVMVSTMASGNTSPYVDVKDVTMLYPIVDIAGLNPLSRRILSNAVGAVCGMVEQVPPRETGGRPLIAASMFGVTTPCVTAARKRLEAAGYDVLVFHATGSGGRAMEGLIADGLFAGVLDVTTTEWADEVVGGVLTAGPDRLSAAGKLGIPQVVSLGACDMVNFGALDTLPERFRGRTLYLHNDAVTLVRTTAEECRIIGRRIAEQLNQATGPVVVLLPMRGVSMIDQPGQPFYDAEADRALFDAVKRHASTRITVREVDAHINDPQFAEALADHLLALLPTPKSA